MACLPTDLVRRIDHFGSTSVPGLWAEPIVDILVEVVDLGETKRRIVPMLEAQGYEYLWRPTARDDTPPLYAWFIKRDAASGRRTRHIHMVEPTFRQHRGSPPGSGGRWARRCVASPSQGGRLGGWTSKMEQRCSQG